MKIIVSYSGGKDSQACLLYAVNKYGSKNIEAVFCDTGWEHPDTYKHIIDTTSELNVKLTVLQSEKYKGMVDLAKKRKRFPSTKTRFCTSELKMIPMIDFILQSNQDMTIIQGIRGNESAERSLMSSQCTFFKYYFEPYKSNKITIERFKFISNPTKTQISKRNKAADRLKQGFNDEKYFTYRKKDVFKYVKIYVADIDRPLFNWTSHQVIDYILQNNQKPNPLYYQGFKRVGCFPCIMCSHQEIRELIKRYPERMQEITDYENMIGSSFFPPDYIPEYARSAISITNRKKFATASDVKKYIESKTGTLFAEKEETFSCSSFYHICE